MIWISAKHDNMAKECLKSTDKEKIPQLPYHDKI